MEYDCNEDETLFYNGNRIPDDFMAGTSINWTYGFNNYPSNVFTSNLFIVNLNSNFSISGTSVNQTEFNYYVNASGTSGIEAGDYQISIVCYSGTDAFTAKVSNITVVANVSNGSIVDTRTPNKVMLDNINAVLSGHITADTNNYTIGGRSLTKLPLAELMDLQTTYQSRVAEELRIERKQSNTLKFKYKDLYEPSVINRKRIY